MTVREFTLPDVGEGVAEGELVSWLVSVGDPVREDQPVAEVETDKALVEVPSPVDGTIRELHAEEGEVVPVGDVLVSFDVAEGGDGDDQPATDDPAGISDADGPAVAADTDDQAGATDAAEPATDPGDVEVPTPGGRIFAPPRVRRLAREEGVDLAALADAGGRITEADVRAAAADDVGTRGASRVSGESAEDVGTQGASRVSGESADRDRTLAAPATRRLAEELGVDIDAVPAVEKRDGEAFVTPEAVREYAERRGRRDDRESGDVPAPDAAAGGDGRRERREPFRGVRRTIADAMVESKYTAPHVTHHDEGDVTRLVEVRETLEPAAAERGVRLTYTPFVVKAVAAALAEFPELNATLDEEREEIVYREYYHVGVATATDAGLMVPVVEDADRKGLLEIAAEIDTLTERARERSIAPEQLRGSTFTITNVGVIGGEYATPILNYPEVGILAVGQIGRKPWVVDRDGEETIEPRSVLPLSLTIDHRLVDGAVAARFTNAVMEYLERPELLLLE